MAVKKDILLKNIIEKSTKVHNSFYDYSLIKGYKNNSSKVPIICPIHGVFHQIMKNHVKGIGCPFCGKKASGLSRTLDIERIIKYSKNKYNDLYSFHESVYKNADTHITINCSFHGDFEQSPRSFLSGRIGCEGCSLRKDSAPEEEVFNFVSGIIKAERNNRDILEGKELDIFLPEVNIAIEFNGLYWHSSKFKEKYYHLNKTKECSLQGIKLIHIFEDEWTLNKNSIKSFLKNLIENKDEFKNIEEEIIEIDRRWGDGTELISRGYSLICETEPTVYTEYNGYQVYDCGTLIFKR